MDYIRNIFQVCFRTRSILAELHGLSFVSKSYSSSLIKSRYALLCLVLTQNCVFKWGNRGKSSCPRNINEDNPKKNFLIEEGILFSLIQDMGLVWRKEIRSLMISAQTCAHINYQLWKQWKLILLRKLFRAKSAKEVLARFRQVI